MDNNYLMHYRTPGSKNGERLYQYKDGSLTPLGREHYGVGPPRGSSTFQKLSKWTAKRKAERDERKAQAAAALEKHSSNKQVSRVANNMTEHTLSSMSDEQLTQAIARLKLEQQYKQYVAKPEKSTFAKELKAIGKDIVKEWVKESGKKYISNFLNASLGLDAQARTDEKLAALAFAEWKTNNYDPKYAPGSFNNSYSKSRREYYNTRNAAEVDRVATLEARARRRNAENAERDYAIARDKYNGLSGNASENEKNNARKAMEKAGAQLHNQRNKLSEAMDKLTPQQRAQVYSDGKGGKDSNQQNNQQQKKKPNN